MTVDKKMSHSGFYSPQLPESPVTSPAATPLDVRRPPHEGDAAPHEQISPRRERALLRRQYLLMLLSAKKDLLISIAFPAIAAAVNVWIAGRDMFVYRKGTQSACFVLVSAAIWGGLFNSLQTIVRERANIRRDYMAGLRLHSYIASRATIQFFLCVIQSAILCGGILAVNWCYANALPKQGVVLTPSILEYYVDLLLLMYAADTFGLFCSCIVRKAETANVMAPYILIVQLIFSGILFDMNGSAELLSYMMLSRWGMEAMGSSSDLNRIPSQSPLEPPSEPMFAHTAELLWGVWVAVIAFSAAFLIGGCLILRRIRKDTRS